MELLPIACDLAGNKRFTGHPACQDSIYLSVDYYKIVGFESPWICYYASIGGELVGSAGFKGKPVDGKVEIAYATFPEFRGKGIGSQICGKLVALALQADPDVSVTARTLPEENHSTRILKKNNFVFAGTVHDKDDGDVWEWVYAGRGD
jgi:RimJ/RimL family protein N-acetyltransferase